MTFIQTNWCKRIDLIFWKNGGCLYDDGPALVNPRFLDPYRSFVTLLEYFNCSRHTNMYLKIVYKLQVYYLFRPYDIKYRGIFLLYSHIDYPGLQVNIWTLCTCSRVCSFYFKSYKIVIDWVHVDKMDFHTLSWSIMSVNPCQHVDNFDSNCCFYRYTTQKSFAPFTQYVFVFKTLRVCYFAKRGEKCMKHYKNLADCSSK